MNKKLSEQVLKDILENNKKFSESYHNAINEDAINFFLNAVKGAGKTAVDFWKGYGQKAIATATKWGKDIGAVAKEYAQNAYKYISKNIAAAFAEQDPEKLKSMADAAMKQGDAATQTAVALNPKTPPALANELKKKQSVRVLMNEIKAKGANSAEAVQAILMNAGNRFTQGLMTVVAQTQDYPSRQEKPAQPNSDNKDNSSNTDADAAMSV